MMTNEDQFQLATYKKMPIAAERGDGVWIYTSDADKYLDLYGGHAVAGTGHCHPHVVDAIRKQASQLLFYKRRIDPTAYLVLWQAGVAGDRSLARFSTGAEYRRVLVDVLARDYPLDHALIIYCAATLPIEEPRIERVRLADIADARVELADTLVIPPARPLEVNQRVLARLARLERAGRKR